MDRSTMIELGYLPRNPLKKYAMDFNVYDRTRQQSTRSSLQAPMIRTTHKGLVTFNPAAVRLMGWNVKDGIRILQSKENGADFYIQLDKSESAYILRKVASGLGFNCSHLASAFFDAASKRKLIGADPKKQLSFQINDTPIDIDGRSSYPILFSTGKQ